MGRLRGSQGVPGRARDWPAEPQAWGVHRKVFASRETSSVLRGRSWGAVASGREARLLTIVAR